jgi:hypothetical protein
MSFEVQQRSECLTVNITIRGKNCMVPLFVVGCRLRFVCPVQILFVCSRPTSDDMFLKLLIDGTRARDQAA